MSVRVEGVGVMCGVWMCCGATDNVPVSGVSAGRMGRDRNVRQHVAAPNPPSAQTEQEGYR